MAAMLEQQAGRVLMVICAWCTAVMSPGTLPASHGICPDCMRRTVDDETYAQYLADRRAIDPRD